MAHLITINKKIINLDRFDLSEIEEIEKDKKYRLRLFKYKEESGSLVPVLEEDMDLLTTAQFCTQVYNPPFDINTDLID